MQLTALLQHSRRPWSQAHAGVLLRLCLRALLWQQFALGSDADSGSSHLLPSLKSLRESSSVFETFDSDSASSAKSLMFTPAELSSPRLLSEFASSSLNGDSMIFLGSSESFNGSAGFHPSAKQLQQAALYGTIQQDSVLGSAVQALSPAEVCSMPEVIGTGPYRIPRWYFNPSTQKCELFYYSGCCGNANNFPTFEGCQVLCEVDPCTQPRDSGSGTLQTTRYYFNQNSKLCEQFTYSGAGGNRNNFPGVLECRNHCPEQPNPCAFGEPMRSGSGPMHCSASAGGSSCPQQTHYCHVGASPATTVCCPHGPGDRCFQPQRDGIGSENLSRWSFDQISQECRQFNYNGLQGNQNNFLTRLDCENACFINPCGTGLPYRQGSQIAQCSARNAQSCPPERYFCHVGADVRTTVCCPAQGEPCSQPRMVGNGQSSINRWYLDPQSRQCRPFTYTGMGGNQNNFQTEEDCKRICHAFVNACVRNNPAMAPNGFPMSCSSDSGCPPGFWCHVGSNAETTMCCPGAQMNPCLVPVSQGIGQEHVSRWHYDPDSRRCMQFNYAGLGGNQNNFRSREECARLCPEFINPCPAESQLLTEPGPGGIQFPLSCASDVLQTGSCPFGAWCHRGATAETTFCCTGGQDPCSLSMAAGSGNAQLSRWWFNLHTLQCAQFTYSGIRGNANNFLTQQECAERCPVFQSPCANRAEPAKDASGRPQSCNAATNLGCPSAFFCHAGATLETTVCCPSTGNRCELPMAEGVGSHSLPRYYFQSQSRQCLPFAYRGTQGNENNFLSLEACAQRCPVFANPCEPQSGTTPAALPQSCAHRPSACPAGFFCHIGASEETTVCCRGGADRCIQPMLVGQGTASLPRFYYNQLSRQCLAFTYRGYFGNANSFTTREECEKTCQVFENPCAVGEPMLASDGKPRHCNGVDGFTCPINYYCHVGAQQETTVCCRSGGDPCRLPNAEGQGANALPRWFYDATARTCRQFNYRGMLGNENNFVSRQECETVCRVFDNPCLVGEPLLGQNERPATCDQQTCPGNYWCHFGAMAETTVCCPGRQDACQLPVAQGTGTAVLPRWFFDATTKSCRSFTYSGVKGNQNNFLTKQDCEAQCPIFVNPCPTPLTSNVVNYCSPANVDVCPIGHWCHIGADRDSTICCPNAGAACSQTMERGASVGRSTLTRWFYDSTTRDCRTFTYSGMGGNQNNFLTRQACETACPVWQNPCAEGEPFLVQSRPQVCGLGSNCPSTHWCHFGATMDTTACCPNGGDVCAQPQAVGAGSATLPRWFFNSITMQCAAFSYRGTKGNQNNFLTRQECETICPVFENPCASGFPAVAAGRPMQCSRFGQNCQPGFWCHVGAKPETTVCCPGAGDVCAQPRAVGTGQAQLQRWFFDAVSRQCMQFTYAGAMGNQNNFLSLPECARACPVLENPCANGPPLTDISGRPQQCSSVASNCGPNFYCHVGASSDTTVCCPGRPEDACRLPLAQGQGNSALPRWYFNANSRQCETFSYRGVHGNQNNFLRKEDCERICQVFENPCPTGDPLMAQSGRPVACSFGSSSCGNNYWCHLGASPETTMCCPGYDKSACNRSRHSGTGNLTLLRWFYNSSSQHCEMFTYRGLKGNANNFLSPDDCESSCPALASACTGLPVVEGNGNAALRRFFYDLSTRQCRPFTYRGLRGNANNFLTMEDCERTCPVWRNPCIENVDSPSYCSVGSGICHSGQWCHIGYDRETTVCCPGAVDDQQACMQPVLPGAGTATLPRFYFNTATRQCVAFTYRGTKGNQNNFLTQQACEQHCPVFTNPCLSGQPLLNPNGRPQTCSALSAASCPSNYWCHVGDRAETTICCPGSNQNICQLPLSVGAGNASLPRWYYSPGLRRCQQFTYGGIRGNQNNFVTQEACQAACREFENPCSGQPATTQGQVIFCSATNKDNCPVNFWCHLGATPETTLCCPGATNPCSVPLAPGTGNSNLQRWYYNADSRQCVSFTYNGIGGNQNNFLARTECEATCPVWINPCFAGQTPAAASNGRPLVCSNSGLKSLCPKGFWCHIGPNSEDAVCCPKSNDTSPCDLQRAPGLGTHSLSRWYSESSTRKCTQFSYAGRNGNENNFLTRDDCLLKCPEFENPCRNGEPEKNEFGSLKTCFAFLPMSCGHGFFCHVGTGDAMDDHQGSNHCCPAFGDACIAPKVEGEGKNQFRRFYFNSLTNDCEMFLYRGKKGNLNNFLSKEECMRVCIPEKNPCATPDQPLKIKGKNVICSTLKKDKSHDTCPETHFCHVGADQFSTACCPKRGEPCEQPLTVGSGTSKRLTRWYYNKEEDSCMQFGYSGLAGNQNNFNSKALCDETCPGFRGFCPHAKPLLVSGTPASCDVRTACPSSNYVCHVNTERKTSVCCPDPAWFCVLPRDPGPCSEFTTRYGYNRETGTCIPFQFGGCGGSLNNFPSLETCTIVCCNKGF